ncbi:MAG TPA: toll/interleukin-1 receptor domain-containing protein [Ktedonobacterales bacterium]
MGDKLFISYRRDDSIDICGRIYDRLSAYFGRAAVFKDVDSIPLGVNFATYINTFISQCAVQLVVIGPRWASIANERGRRLDDPADLVRLEVEAALQANLVVIPVLVGGATLPTAEQLPESLRPLAALPPLPVDPDLDFDGDIIRLMRLLTSWLSPAPGAPPLPEVDSLQESRRARLLPRFLRSTTTRRRLAQVTVPALLLGLLALVVSGGAYLSQQLTTLQAITAARSGFIRQMTSVSGTNEVWIAGSDGDKCLIERFDGQQLVRTNCPYSGTLDTISMLSPTDGWAAGAEGLLLHYSGRTWTKVASPTGEEITTLAMFSPTDGWAATELGQVTLHYTGGAWKLASLGFKPSAFARVSATEGWAVGQDDTDVTSHVVYHYLQGQWQPAPFFGGLPFLSSMCILPDGTEGWAVSLEGDVAHYVRGVWLQSKSPLPTTGSKSDLMAVSAVTSGEAWAVGGAPTGGSAILLHYTAKGWQRIDVPWQAEMYTVVALPNGEAWAAGYVESTGGSDSYTLLLRYQHGAWSTFSW